MYRCAEWLRHSYRAARCWTRLAACRIYVSRSNFNLSRKKLQGRFREKSVKTDFPTFLSTFPGLVDFWGGISGFLRPLKIAAYFYHFADMLKFWFFLNLTAGFRTISFKKSGGCKKYFYSIWGTSCVFRVSMIFAWKDGNRRFLLHFWDMLRRSEERRVGKECGS